MRLRCGDADFGWWRLRRTRLQASGGNVRVGRMNFIMPGDAPASSRTAASLA
ncbi:MAG: hypothetical protein JWQ17_1453 [Tardiphaga sp.]|nr:hypothetical protein [Tardiphaga sp.]